MLFFTRGCTYFGLGIYTSLCRCASPFFRCYMCKGPAQSFRWAISILVVILSDIYCTNPARMRTFSDYWRAVRGCRNFVFGDKKPSHRSFSTRPVAVYLILLRKRQNDKVEAPSAAHHSQLTPGRKATLTQIYATKRKGSMDGGFLRHFYSFSIHIILPPCRQSRPALRR